MRLDDLRPELREKAENCKTPQEILELAKEEGIELSDEDLENVSGGWGDSESGEQKCPQCGSTDLTCETERKGEGSWQMIRCHRCGYGWKQRF